MKKFFSFLASAALATCAYAQYTNGVFLLNEDWLGHNSSTVNFYSYADGAIQYRVFQKENEGKTLGNTTQFMAQDANNIYFCSKQNYGSTGGRFDIVDAKTLKLKQSFATFAGDGDTRACYPFSDTKVYVGTTKGLYIYNPTTGEITSTPISGTDAKEPGEMVEANGKLLVSALNKGIYVIDTNTDQLEKTIELGKGACTLFKMNDEVWAAVNNCTWGTPSASNIEQFVEIDTQSFEAKTPVTVPMACQNSSFAWKKTSPAIDAKNRVLYYAPVDCGNFISKYDMNTGEFSQNFITIPQGQQMYGNVCDLDPNTGNLVVETFVDYSSQNYYLHIYNKDGEEVGEQIQLTKGYWFPAMVMFAKAEQTPTGITDANAEKAVASVKYFNISGMSSNEPFEGLNIVVTNYTDGSQSAVKKMMK